MKNKKIIRLLSVVLTIILFTNLFMTVYAADTMEQEFIEYTDQVYLDNIDVAIVDKENLLFTVTPDTNVFKVAKAEKEIEKLDSFFDEHPITESQLSDLLQSSDLCAISYTETPLEFKEDHYERISTRAADVQYSEGTSKQKANLTLATAIMRTGSANSAGEYLYTAMTSGEWSKNSILGGSNYPASGDDFVVQTTCKGFVLDEHAMITEYNDGENGTEGTHSYPTKTKDNFIQYSVKDDPLGTKQLTSCVLMANYYGPSKNYTRAIHSVYTHTWKSLSIDVSVEASIDTEMTAGVGISIDPSIKDKSWNLASNVTFKF